MIRIICLGSASLEFAYVCVSAFFVWHNWQCRRCSDQPDVQVLLPVSSLICSGNQSAGNAGGAWLSSTIAVQVWLATSNLNIGMPVPVPVAP